MTVASDEPAPVVPGDPELRSLLETARTIAVVGLSSKPDRHSYRVASYLQDVGYRIIPVNPSESRVLGERAHAALGEVGGPIDIVDVFRRPEHTPAIARQAVDVGARALWLQLGIVNEESGRIARAGGLTVVMGICLMVEHERLLGSERGLLMQKWEYFVAPLLPHNPGEILNSFGQDGWELVGVLQQQTPAGGTSLVAYLKRPVA